MYSSSRHEGYGIQTSSFTFLYENIMLFGFFIVLIFYTLGKKKVLHILIRRTSGGTSDEYSCFCEAITKILHG